MKVKFSTLKVKPSPVPTALLLLFVSFFPRCTNHSTVPSTEADSASHDMGVAHTDTVLHNAGTENEMLAPVNRMIASVPGANLDGDPYLDFMRLLQLHYDAVAGMSELELQRGKDTALKGLARELRSLSRDGLRNTWSVSRRSPSEAPDTLAATQMIRAMHRHLQPAAALSGETDHDFAALMIPLLESSLDIGEIVQGHQRAKPLPENTSETLRRFGAMLQGLRRWLEQEQQGAGLRRPPGS